MVLAGSVKMEIVRNSKVFFLFAREVFSPKAMFSYQNKMVTFNLPTNLHLFVSMSTCFIHSIINILVKKPFSFWGKIPNKVYLGGGNRSHGLLLLLHFALKRLIQLHRVCSDIGPQTEVATL